jgi:periplasmic divalent cation tolerance protein
VIEHRDGVVLVVSTWPDEATALAVARELVDERLAACVQVQPGLTSTYRWQGRVETATEVRMEAKTAPGRLRELQRRLAERHPHDVPEILVVPVVDGLPAYLHWVGAETLHAP